MSKLEELGVMTKRKELMLIFMS